MGGCASQVEVGGRARLQDEGDEVEARVQPAVGGLVGKPDADVALDLVDILLREALAVAEGADGREAYRASERAR
eukprot:COSAG05_NODE_3330_length_2146_cov_39.440535_1_plen_75_part_00